MWSRRGSKFKPKSFNNNKNLNPLKSFKEKNREAAEKAKGVTEAQKKNRGKNREKNREKNRGSC